MQGTVARNKNILVLHLASLTSYVQAEQLGLSMLSQVSCLTEDLRLNFTVAIVLGISS